MNRYLKYFYGSGTSIVNRRNMIENSVDGCPGINDFLPNLISIAREKPERFPELAEAVQENTVVVTLLTSIISVLSFEQIPDKRFVFDTFGTVSTVTITVS